MNETSFSRRTFIRGLAGLPAGAAALKELLLARDSWGQTNSSGIPLPDELIDVTLKRLFGTRSFQSGEGKIKLDLPLIAEDGGSVALTVDSSLPVSGAARVSNVYIFADKNRRPMLVKFSLSPDSGRAFIATSIRLATTTDVRAIVEMSDGTLYSVSKHVRVTISGCDLSPSG